MGFETTAPANAMAVKRAKQLGLANFSILCVARPRAAGDRGASSRLPRIACRAFLARRTRLRRHGLRREYEPLAARYRLPIVVTGFEPLDLLQGIHMAVVGARGRALRRGEPVHALGDGAMGIAPRRAVLAEVFEPCDRAWRGIGVIPKSGYRLRPAYRGVRRRAARFDVEDITADEPTECIAGEILQGRKKPHDCAAFGTRCTPEHPLGAPMVSSEGACAAYYLYARAAVSAT